MRKVTFLTLFVTVFLFSCKQSFEYESPKYGYTIKYRQEVANDLKLFTYKGYVDSLTKAIYLRKSGILHDDICLSIQMKQLIAMKNDLFLLLKNNTERLNYKLDINQKIKDIVSPEWMAK